MRANFRLRKKKIIKLPDFAVGEKMENRWLKKIQRGRKYQRSKVREDEIERNE